MSAKKKTPAQDKAMALGYNPTTTKLSFETQRLQDQPASIAMAVKRAREFYKNSQFLKMFLPLYKSIFDYGCVLKAAGKDGKPPTPEEKEKLAKWMADRASIKFEPVKDASTGEEIDVEMIKTNKEILEDFRNEVLEEARLLDNAVAFWMEGMNYAVTIPVEKCEYKDVLGVPILKYTHGLGEEDVKLLPPDQQELFRKGTVTVNPRNGQHFKVFKRARTGDGFGWPGIYSIFKLLGEVESKEFGFHAMAFHMRNATRAHKLGYGLLQGDRAGKPHAFVWRKERATAVERDWRDVQGARDWTHSFDHEIHYPWPDLKIFDETAWLGSNMRLIQWAGPLGMMLVAKGVMPYLTPLLKAEILREREKFRLFLEPVINDAFKPPVPIKIGWSNLIFNEARLQAELLKFATTQGVISPTTMQEEIGLDPDGERERKLVDMNDPEARKLFNPWFDSSHGISPALGDSINPADDSGGKGPESGSSNGKPPGTQDKS